MSKAEPIVTWVVYRMTFHFHGKDVGGNAVCEASEWDELEAQRPGYHTLIRAGITTEAEAEQMARGSAAAAAGRGS